MEFLVVDKFLAKLSAAIHRALVIAAGTINGCLNQTGDKDSRTEACSVRLDTYLLNAYSLTGNENARVETMHCLVLLFRPSFFNISLEI